MKSSKNKEVLYSLMAEYFMTEKQSNGRTLILTNGNDTLSENMPSSTHLEADWRMVLHIIDGLNEGHTSCKVRANDTDVVIILLAYMPTFLELNDTFQLTLDFGVGAKRRAINLNDLCRGVGIGKCRAMLFFHAFTGILEGLQATTIK